MYSLFAPGSNAGGFFIAAYDYAASVLMPEGVQWHPWPGPIKGSLTLDTRFLQIFIKNLAGVQIYVEGGGPDT